MKKTLIVVLALMPLGCSFYYSSESSMKTLTSPCPSSGSSKGEDKKEAYRDDVRDFTAAYASTHQDFQAFEHGLGEVARRHGNHEVALLSTFVPPLAGAHDDRFVDYLFMEPNEGDRAPGTWRSRSTIAPAPAIRSRSVSANPTP